MYKGLYTIDEFNITGANDYFLSLNKDITLKDMNLDKVNKNIDALIIYLNTYEKAPKFVLTRALYSDSNNQLTYARFIIRPSISYELGVKDVREVFTIIGDDNFFDNLLSNIVNWFDNYTYYVQLGVNIECLNLIIRRLLEKNNIDIDAKFTLGDGLKDVTDTSILIGLKDEVIKKLSGFALFSDEDIWREKCEKDFLNLFKECSRPYDILKLKSELTKELGIYQRKSLNKLIRQVVTRRIDYVRVGIGYTEDSERFAVIQRDAVTEDSLSNYNLGEVIVKDNENITSQENKEGLTKIVTYFRVSPFYKKTGLPIDITIKRFLEETKVV